MDESQFKQFCFDARTGAEVRKCEVPIMAARVDGAWRLFLAGREEPVNVDAVVDSLSDPTAARALLQEFMPDMDATTQEQLLAGLGVVVPLARAMMGGGS